MKVERAADNPAAPMDASHFSGDVTRRELGNFDAPAATLLSVTFPAGARTHWHRHPDGQFLYVTAGRARVGTRDGAVAEVSVGDVVHAPPNEEHWHGAATDEAATHLAVSLGETEWLEEVTD
jgi:quercetin dioxygenase-like cupin family protein